MAGASDSPPAKRQRSDNTDDGSTDDPRTRSEYWFQDGNVVLQAEDTLFRVHRTILARQSDIFDDTFSLKQDPSQENELIEGCPVVYLSDTAEDIGNIISLLYDSNRSLNIDKDLTVRVLGSMLRLGRKYAFTYIENKALEAIHHDYPTTLKDWDFLSGSLDRRRIKYNAGPRSDTTTQVISIGHEFDLFTILPAAYVRYLQQYSLVASYCLKTLWFLIFEQEAMAIDDRLPEEARQICLVGNSRILEYLKEKSVGALCPPLIIPSEGCSSRRKCEPNKWQTIKDLPIWTTDESRSSGLFCLKYLKVSEDLCLQCRKEAKELTDRVRSDFWSLLPTFFELPAWKDLKDGV